MSTTHCETGIVRIRVGLFNDILRFVRALCIILYGESYYFIFNCIASLGPPCGFSSSPPYPSLTTVHNLGGGGGGGVGGYNSLVWGVVLK